MNTKELNISTAGRVEGDLDISVYLEKGIITRANTNTTVSHKLDTILKGKDPQAGLIITPRACGICGGSHLYSASSALDTAWKTKLSPNALLLRAIGQASESLQSCPRWFYAIFAPDMTNKKFAGKPLYNEVVRRWSAYIGSSFGPGVTASARPIEIYAIFGGQWPHSSYMVPGGVTSNPTLKDITRSYAVLEQFRTDFLETIWLGCSVERYQQIKSWDDMMIWLEESESHRNSDLGLYLRAGIEFGLDKFGQGLGKYISYGTYLHKDLYNTPSIEGRNDALIMSSGFYDGEKYQTFDHNQIIDHVKQNLNRAHLTSGTLFERTNIKNKSSIPDRSALESKYNWAQSPRYMSMAAEVGPLARNVMNANPYNLDHQIQDPLFGDIMQKMGPSVFVRSLARMHEMVSNYTCIMNWLSEIRLDDEFYIKPEEHDGLGFGATEAARGALAHWIEIENGVIKNYQIVAPSTWNIGPKDENGNPGAFEAALMGLEIEDKNDPVEVGLVARSFDSCLVCTVHAHDNKSGKELARFKL